MTSIFAADRKIRAWSWANGPVVVRIALGIVFVWFGALKLVGRSPVESLVASTAPWVPKDILLKGLGGWEVLVGIGLITGFAIRLVLAMFVVQMISTFASAVVQPHLMFQGNDPWALTLEGEFLVKNLVLLAAGVASAASVPAPSKAKASRMLIDKARTFRT